MVNFTFRTAAAASAVVVPINLGTHTLTTQTATQAMYIEHDSASELSNVGAFIQPYSGTGYVGLYGVSEDFIEVADWGTNSGKGFMVNQDAAATNAGNTEEFRSGGTATGVAASNAIPISSSAFLVGPPGTDGYFPVGQTAHMTFFMAFPSSATSAGRRMFNLMFKYDL